MSHYIRSLLWLLVVASFSFAQDPGNAIPKQESTDSEPTTSRVASKDEVKYYVWYKQRKGDKYVGDGPWTYKEASRVQGQYTAKGYYSAYIGLRNGMAVN